MALLFGISFLLLGALVMGESPCSSHTPGTEWKADPRDCSKFYLCFNGRRFNFTCSSSVWDPDTKTCVPTGSQWDKCTAKHELESLTPCSDSNTAVEPKSDHCAQFYDCSSKEATVSRDPHVKECPYPMLFSEETTRCEAHNLVKCGNRKEVLDPCEYHANQCRSAHCIPCSIRFPSCRGLPEGMNHWVGREWSPYFVVCSGQRVVYHGQCDLSHTVSLFNPDKKVCEEAKKNLNDMK